MTDVEKITIILAAIAAFFAAITFIYMVISDKKKKTETLRLKEEELRSIKSWYESGTVQNVSMEQYRQIKIRKDILEFEIQQLKK